VRFAEPIARYQTFAIQDPPAQRISITTRSQARQREPPPGTEESATSKTAAPELTTNTEATEAIETIELLLPPELARGFIEGYATNPILNSVLADLRNGSRKNKHLTLAECDKMGGYLRY